MTAAVVTVCALAVIALQAFVCNVLRKALEKQQAENKRLVAIITAPTAGAAHAAALERPPRPPRDDDQRPVPPVGA